MTHIAQVPVKCTTADGEVVIVPPGQPLPPLLSDADIQELRAIAAITDAAPPAPAAAPEPARRRAKSAPATPEPSED